MSLKAVVRKGDPTTGGGVVLGGEETFTSSGTPVARVGDVATCTVPGHPGTVRIVEGSARHRCQGKGMAYDGCMLSCGCRVLATSQAFRIEIEDAPRSLGGPGGFAPALERTSNHGSLSRQAKHEEKAALSAEDRGREGEVEPRKTTLAPDQDTDIQRRESWQGYQSPQEVLNAIVHELDTKYGNKGNNQLKTREFGTVIYVKHGQYYYAPIVQGPIPRPTDRKATVNPSFSKTYLTGVYEVHAEMHSHPTMNWATGVFDKKPLKPSGGDYETVEFTGKPGYLWRQGSPYIIKYDMLDSWHSKPEEKIILRRLNEGK